MSARFGSALVPMTAILLGILGCGSKSPTVYDSPPMLANRDEITAAMHAVGAGLEARVVLQVRVDDRGYVREARVAQSSGMPELDDAAVWIGEQMRFRPAQHQGQPVSALVEIPVTFDVVSEIVRPPKLKNAAPVEATIASNFPDLRGTARFRVQIGSQGEVLQIRERRPSDRGVLSAAQDLIEDWIEFWPGYNASGEITAWISLTIEFAGEYSRVYLEVSET